MRSVAAAVVVATLLAGCSGSEPVGPGWHEMAPLLHARSAHAVVSDRETVYALGGTGEGGSPVLAVERFDGRVWLVSKCGERVQQRTRKWLVHHRFFEATGIDPGNLRFCLQRPEKALHCRDLQITHFIDDRPDVLVALDGIVPHRYLFGPQRKAAPRGVVPVITWQEALLAVEAELDRSDQSCVHGRGVRGACATPCSSARGASAARAPQS